MRKIELAIIITHLIIILYEVYCSDMVFIIAHVIIIILVEVYYKMKLN